MIKRTKNPNFKEKLFDKTFSELTSKEKDKIIQILAEKFNLVKKEIRNE